ncbi:MAG: hypothetical protein AB7I48_15895 [Planctomycetaceae bacterium]
MPSNKWKTARHARKPHCFWIIFHNGPHREQQAAAQHARVNEKSIPATRLPRQGDDCSN